MTAPPGPFVEPADASNDALWLQRARAERPFATQFFNSPINQGKAWRALAGLQAGTRLLVSGDSDMIWPASGTYGPEGSNEHGSMKGDAAQGFAVGARPGQPPNLVRIMFDTDDKWRAFCLALDADGGVWVRGNFPNDKKHPFSKQADHEAQHMPYPGFTRLQVPFRATAMVRGRFFIDNTGSLWELDDWACRVTRLVCMKGDKEFHVNISQMDGEIVLTAEGVVTQLETPGQIPYLCPPRAHYEAECADVFAFNVTLGSSDRDQSRVRRPPPPPPRCTHPPSTSPTPGKAFWNDAPPVPGTGPGAARVVSIAAVRGPDLGKLLGSALVFALTSAGELWASWTRGKDQWNTWEFLPEFSSPHNTRVAAVGWQALRLNVMVAVYTTHGADVPLRIGTLYGDGQITKLGTGENSGSKIKVETFPVFQNAAIAQVALGSRHNAVLTQGGEVYTWGKNSGGQLGQGGTSLLKSVKVPSKVVFKPDEFTGTTPFVTDVAVGKDTTACIAFPPLPSHLRSPPGPGGKEAKGSAAKGSAASVQPDTVPSGSTSCCLVM